jgi:hypothetical protein
MFVLSRMFVLNGKRRPSEIRKINASQTVLVITSQGLLGTRAVGSGQKSAASIASGRPGPKALSRLNHGKENPGVPGKLLVRSV